MLLPFQKFHTPTAYNICKISKLQYTKKDLIISSISDQATKYQATMAYLAFQLEHQEVNS